MIFYDCPKCGKSKSSWDGTQFCGPCETKYRKDQADFQAFEAEIRRKIRSIHSDDCECNLCSSHSGPTFS